MKIIRTAPFERDYKKLPTRTRKKFEKALRFLVRDPLHPSLRAKKMKPKWRGIWEARVNRFYRFTYKKKNDTVILRTVGPHDEVLKRG